jgi:flagellar basal-body rod protein FlgF
MDNSILITLSAQNALQRQMEVAANNMANVSTTGFKAENILFEPITKKPASVVENPKTVTFVRDYTIARDFRPGTLQQTGNPLDVALTGEGFFAIQTPTGVSYTRDGRFTMDTNGQVITHDGKAVLDDANSPITIDPTLGSVLIGKDGNITQNGAQIAKIGVFSFNRPGALDKIGDNLLRPNQASGQAQIPTSFEVSQGMLEGSNVVAVQELTKIMEISRAFESATKLQKQTEDLQSKAIERLGRIQA